MSYTLTGQKSGSVSFEQTGTVTGEDKSLSGQITKNPIESGSDINDHFIADPEKFTVKGVAATGLDAVVRLEKMLNSGDICTYSGRVQISNTVMTSLSYSISSTNKLGADFTASFQKIQIAGSQWVPIDTNPTMAQQDAGKSPAMANAGATRNEGLKTPMSQDLSDGAYAKYVNSYNSKPIASKGPENRQRVAYDGLRGN